MYRAPIPPDIAELRYSGTPTTASFTYDVILLQQSSSFVTITNNTNIELPEGHYYVQALPDFTRASATRNNQVFWFLDGNQIGKEGGSDYYQSQSTDIAEATFTLHESGTLTLRQTAWSGSAIVLTNDSLIYIWRVPR